MHNFHSLPFQTLQNVACYIGMIDVSLTTTQKYRYPDVFIWDELDTEVKIISVSSDHETSLRSPVARQ